VVAGTSAVSYSASSAAASIASACLTEPWAPFTFSCVSDDGASTGSFLAFPVCCALRVGRTHGSFGLVFPSYIQREGQLTV
jgi:hypothetical protein